MKNRLSGWSIAILIGLLVVTTSFVLVTHFSSAAVSGSSAKVGLSTSPQGSLTSPSSGGSLLTHTAPTQNNLSTDDGSTGTPDE